MEEDSAFTDKGIINAGSVGKVLYRWIILFFTIAIYSEVAEDPSKFWMVVGGFFGFFSVVWMGMKESLYTKYEEPKEKTDEEEV